VKSILSKNKKESIDELFYFIDSVCEINHSNILNLAELSIKFSEASADIRNSAEHPNRLTDRWIKSLEQGSPDYGVYGEEGYFAELIACWIVYSRKYLLEVKKKLYEFSDPKVIVDLGCGFGFTTAGIKSIFPNASVYGTNLIGTLQYQICEKVGEKYNFKMVNDIHDVNGEIDLVFGFEYFEHFESPVEHLIEILSKNPKQLLVANTFGSMAIGHFENYNYRGISFPRKEMQKKFNDCLVDYGYEQGKIGFWNSRPQYWTRRELQMSDEFDFGDITWTTKKVKIKEIRDWDKNPRRISKKDAADLKFSIKKFGLAEPLVVNLDYSLIGGHQRKKLINVPELEIDVRVPNRMLTEKEAAELGIRLNKNTGTWDDDALANFFNQEDLISWGFTEDQLLGEEFEGGDGEGRVPVGEPELKISPELFERHDYIVFYFDNELDWNVINELFQLQVVFTAPVGGKTLKQKGLGRIIPGKKLLEIINRASG